MTFNENYDKFNYYVGDKVEELREEGWSDGKIAFYLRDLAQSISPRGRKPSKITIDPLKISDEEILKLPKEIQDRIKIMKEKFGKLMEDKSEQ